MRYNTFKLTVSFFLPAILRRCDLRGQSFGLRFMVLYEAKEQDNHEVITRLRVKTPNALDQDLEHLVTEYLLLFRLFMLIHPSPASCSLSVRLFLFSPSPFIPFCMIRRVQKRKALKLFLVQFVEYAELYERRRRLFKQIQQQHQTRVSIPHGESSSFLFFKPDPE